MSIDPALELSYLRGRGELDSENAGETLDATWSAFRALLTVSVSGWFGKVKQ